MQPIVTDAATSACRSVSVCLSVYHNREPCKNAGTDRGAIWVVDLDGPKEPCIRGEGEKGQPTAKYRDPLS